MDEYESLSHKQVGVQISCCVHSQVPEEDALGGVEAAPRGCVSQAGTAKGKPDRRREGHLMPDHVHMMISIPPKYAVSQVVGFIKGKSGIHLARVYGEKKRNFLGGSIFGREGTSSRP
jgi:putative transposase